MNIFSSKSTMLHIVFINLESNANSIKDFIKKKTKILFSNSTQFFWTIQHLKLIHFLCDWKLFTLLGAGFFTITHDTIVIDKNRKGKFRNGYLKL